MRFRATLGQQTLPSAMKKLTVLQYGVTVCFFAGIVLSCGRTATLRTMTVCEAITQPVGQRIRVQGEFGGFTYETGSTTFLMPGTVCASQELGLYWWSCGLTLNVARYLTFIPVIGDKHWAILSL